LCTDMDRTVIPNGMQAEDTQARRRFRDFCSSPDVTLVYVTGRHRALVREAITEYALPEPDYVITDVGTRIYRVAGDRWYPLEHWENEIERDWNGRSHGELMQLLAPVGELLLQEDSKQNTHKLSYYLPLHCDHERVMAETERLLEAEGVEASLIWSIDEPENIGLLDVLPRNATKLHAIEFIYHELGYGLEEVLFAGDSGNDLPVLSSEVRSVLVANADKGVQEAAQRLAAEHGHADALYLAKERGLGMNGNYAAGVLQGVWHFLPAFRELLEERGGS